MWLPVKTIVVEPGETPYVGLLEMRKEHSEVGFSRFAFDLGVTLLFLGIPLSIGCSDTRKVVQPPVRNDLKSPISGSEGSRLRGQPQPKGWETQVEGSPWTGRLGDGPKARALTGGGDERCETAVLEGLLWLARHQGADGGWHAKTFSDRCIGTKCSDSGDSKCDVGVSGLALLAFLGRGYTQLSSEEYVDPGRPGLVFRFGEVVKRSQEWLLSHQDSQGGFGARDEKYMYNHALATQAIAEAYGMTRAENLKAPAEKAVAFLVAAQTPGKGWRYVPGSGDSDSSVTGWCVLALRSARYAELSVPRETLDSANAWFDSVTTNDHDVGYTSKAATGLVIIPWDSEKWVDHDTLCALALLSRMSFGQSLSDAIRKGLVQRLVCDPPAGNDKTDYVYWNLGSLALFQQDGPKGDEWRKWNEAIMRAIFLNRASNKQDCKSGSWNASERWGRSGGGGQVYATAINVLTLETYYRY